MITFTISRLSSNLVSSGLLVDLTVGGTATFGVDYTVAGNDVSSYTQTQASVIIPAGELSTDIVVTPITDLITEGDETIILTIIPTLSMKAGASLSASATIVDKPPVSTIALLQFEGANGSTAIVNSGGISVFTSFGSAAISTLNAAPGGTSSLLLNSLAKFIESPYSAELDFNADFEWSADIRPNLSAANMYILGNAVSGSAGNSGLFVAINNGTLVFRHLLSTTTSAAISGIVLNQWQSFKARRVGTVITLSVNEATASGSIVAATPQNPFRIGIGQPASVTGFNAFSGFIDNVRLTKI